MTPGISNSFWSNGVFPVRRNSAASTGYSLANEWQVLSQRRPGNTRFVHCIKFWPEFLNVMKYKEKFGLDMVVGQSIAV
jgi:hypothetical protein